MQAIVSPARLVSRPKPAHLVLVRAKAKVLERLAGILRAAEEERVGARRRAERQLVERQGLTAGRQDARAGRRGEAQRSDAQLGHLEQAAVVRHRADDHDRLLGVVADDVGGDARQRDRGAVHARHEETLQNDLVEVRVGSACCAATKQSEWLAASAMATPPRLHTSGRKRGEKLTDKEPVELHQELEVDIVALGSHAVRAAHMVLVQIDTCE